MVCIKKKIYLPSRQAGRRRGLGGDAALRVGGAVQGSCRLPFKREATPVDVPHLLILILVALALIALGNKTLARGGQLLFGLKGLLQKYNETTELGKALDKAYFRSAGNKILVTRKI